MIEASVFGKPNLGLKLPATLDPVGYEQANAYLPVMPRQLGPVANAVLQDQAQLDDLLQKQGEFAKDWCYHEGNAAECTADFIEVQIRHSTK